MGVGLVIGALFGALGLAVVGTAIASSGSPRRVQSGADAAGGGYLEDGHEAHHDDEGLLWMTCEQAITYLPDDLPMHDKDSFRVYVASVLKHSNDAAGMDGLATEVEKNAGAGAHTDVERGACLRVAQCLRDRASLVRLISSGSLGRILGAVSPARADGMTETTGMSSGPSKPTRADQPAKATNATNAAEVVDAVTETTATAAEIYARRPRPKRAAQRAASPGGA